MTGMPASRSVCLSVFVVVGLGICALVGSDLCTPPRPRKRTLSRSYSLTATSGVRPLLEASDRVSRREAYGGGERRPFGSTACHRDPYVDGPACACGRADCLVRCSLPSTFHFGG